MKLLETSSACLSPPSVCLKSSQKFSLNLLGSFFHCPHNNTTLLPYHCRPHSWSLYQSNQTASQSEQRYHQLPISSIELSYIIIHEYYGAKKPSAGAQGLLFHLLSSCIIIGSSFRHHLINPSQHILLL